MSFVANNVHQITLSDRYNSLTSREQENWIAAHVNAFNFFGGIPRILVPDNLKTGVIKNTRAELVLNKSYQEMAEHHGTAIIPARVRKPKDKAVVEGVVGNITTFILAAIRNQRFFSLRELAGAIGERLGEYNNKAFQKKGGSRATMFAEEKLSLLPLPARIFELSSWKIATVQYNYHIEVDGQFYSVPYEYIKRKVDARITKNVIEAFFEGERICSHQRLYGRQGQYSTQEGHMPANHQQHSQWNSDRFRKWAAKIGQNTAAVVEGILTGYKVEQQGYRACMALLKMSDEYGAQRLEAACAKGLGYTPRPAYKTIKTILKTGQDKVAGENTPNPAPSEFGFTRGAAYYKKGGE